MRIKSYFAGSVEEAMDKARRELGTEAMLMNSKKTELELRSLGAYEVVFAVMPEESRATEVRSTGIPGKSAESLAAAVEARGSSNDLVRELAELRKQIETVRRSVDRRPTSLPSAGPLGPDGAEMVARLRDADISEGLAVDLAAAIEKRYSRNGAAGSFEAAVRAECDQRLRFSPALVSSAAAPRAVVFVGPSGAGKTTTLVKLALRFGLRARLPLQLLSLDTLRIGGCEQLASYARIAGIPCQALHTPAALEQAFTEFGGKKLMLIDTPGFSPADGAQIRSLAARLSCHRDLVETHLVLPATAQPRVQFATIERFANFTPAKLLFTHLDETESAGPLLETALRAGLPLSFLGNGQQVPEDIDEASLDRILGSLAGGNQSSRRIASAA
jgi:flagellar biosynthesis protein FlhF